VQDRARAFQWLLFEQTSFRPPLSTLVRLTRFTPAEKQDKQAIEHAWSEVRTNMGILQTSLSGRDYIGGTFSIADLAILPYVYLATELGLDLSPWLTVAVYFTRLSARPTWQKVIGWK